MKLLAVADRIDSTIAEIRLGLPLRTLAAERGWALRLCSTLEVDDAALAAADVLVVQRAVTRRSLALIEAMRRGGGHAVYEIDDLLTEPAPHLLGYRQALRQVRWVRRGLAAADVVSVSTPRLAQALQPLARQVMVVPNHAWPGAPQAAPWDAQGPLHLLLAASDHVAAGGLLPALQQLLQQRPGRARLVAVGPAAAALAAAGLPAQVLPLMPRPAFMDFVAALPQGVVLMPLGETRFDACKSAIKFFDCAAMGVPALCSNLPPYADVMQDGDNGRLVAPGAEAWLAALTSLVDNPAQAQAWACRAAADVAARHTLGHSCAAWAALFESLGPRRFAAPPAPWWQAAWRGGLRRVQQLNRQRLERRQRRTQESRAE